MKIKKQQYHLQAKNATFTPVSSMFYQFATRIHGLSLTRIFRHCTGGSEVEQKNSCDATPRDYNIPLRVGLLFVILTTSAIGVFGPILLHKILPDKFNLLFIVLKQFGTGIIVSTAFIHVGFVTHSSFTRILMSQKLFTHASLMFNNECLGELGYEGTTSAILMAGIFLSFFVEYIGQRVVQAKIRSESALTFKEKAGTLLNSDIVSILVMEGGIIFHSLRKSPWSLKRRPY